MMRKFAAVAGAFFLGVAGMAAWHAHAQAPHGRQHSFSGAERWAHEFDDPARDEWQKPHQVIQSLDLAPDAVVADIGSGTGYFAIRLAHVVPKGRVYGVDIEPDMVRYLSERAQREGAANLAAVAGRPDDSRLPSRVDLVLMVDVYHHVADRGAYFRKLRSSLKPGGRVAIIDFRRKAPMGPPVGERIAPEMVKSEMKGAGYALAKEYSFLPNKYFLVFRLAGS